MAHLQLPVVLGENCMSHNFVVITSLVVPVILGVDFLHTHGLMLDFSIVPVKITEENPSTLAIYNAEHAEKLKRYPIALLLDANDTDVVEECVMPWFKQEDLVELPHSSNSVY